MTLRCDRLREASLWFDEAVSFTSIHDFSWSEMIRRTGEAVHPPLYYICLRLWCSVFGLSVVAMSSLSVALALLTMLRTYLFCRDAFANSEKGEQDGCRQSCETRISRTEIWCKSTSRPRRANRRRQPTW